MGHTALVGGGQASTCYAIVGLHGCRVVICPIAGLPRYHDIIRGTVLYGRNSGRHAGPWKKTEEIQFEYICVNIYTTMLSLMNGTSASFIFHSQRSEVCNLHVFIETGVLEFPRHDCW